MSWRFRQQKNIFPLANIGKYFFDFQRVAQSLYPGSFGQYREEFKGCDKTWDLNEIILR
jgi:hypothetical protein